MKKLLMIIAIAISIFPFVCNAESTNTIVGELMLNDQGGVILGVDRDKYGSKIIMFTSDRHGINRVALRLSTDDVKQLRNLLDDTLAEYDKPRR